MGDFKGSVVDIQRPWRSSRATGARSAGLGQIYTALGDDEAALRAFKRALEINRHRLVRAKIKELEKSSRSARSSHASPPSLRGARRATKQSRRHRGLPRQG